MLDIFTSTIIPTINRSTLPRAVRSVLDQDFHSAGFEVIVVNDSGMPLPDADWQHSPQVRVIDTNRHERSVARNTGAAVAKGEYFHFLDDDDLIVPGALNSFWNLYQNNPADWLYGGYQTVDNQGNTVNQFCPELKGNILAYLIASEAIPFQASLLKAKSFYRAGCYDPKLTGPEDRDLGRRMALNGEIAGTLDIVAKIRIGELGSTTDWSTLAEKDRWGREKALREPNAFGRIRESAKSSELHGRVCRAYLASFAWNVKRRSPLIALSRACMAVYFSFPSLLTSKFWEGLRTMVD
jgi:hypothetical protein